MCGRNALAEVVLLDVYIWLDAALGARTGGDRERAAEAGSVARKRTSCPESLVRSLDLGSRAANCKRNGVPAKAGTSAQGTARGEEKR
jgi:hypothetical protein